MLRSFLLSATGTETKSSWIYSDVAPTVQARALKSGTGTMCSAVSSDMCLASGGYTLLVEDLWAACSTSCLSCMPTWYRARVSCCVLFSPETQSPASVSAS